MAGVRPETDETPLSRDGHRWSMVPLDPAFLFILGALLLFVFFLFLMIRRTLVGFREGMDRGRD
ncbi:Uncharacterized protein HSRCO_2848 [Halanaeroarchaeum sp. HSR-CO]|nr:Uncharacterized protein HSRCO_2848 [Halanaeroarchaeum sp. HSR-CO]